MTTNKDRPIECDFPALFRAADRLSIEGQNQRRRFFVWFVSMDLAASLLAEFHADSTVISILVLLVVVGGLLTTIALLQEGPENEWYGGRAVAESAKTLSWRYMMCAEPFIYGLPQNEAEQKLLLELSELQNANRELMSGLSVEDAKDLQITTRMRLFRKREVQERKKDYLEFRIQNQQGWYTQKAKWAKSRLRSCRRLLFFIQLLIVTDAVCMVALPHRQFSAIGLFSAIAAALLAWQELNQFEGVAIAYNLAANDLASIQCGAETVGSENELSMFVLNAERAISREHTLWLARRTR